MLKKTSEIEGRKALPFCIRAPKRWAAEQDGQGFSMLAGREHLRHAGRVVTASAPMFSEENHPFWSVWMEREEDLRQALKNTKDGGPPIAQGWVSERNLFSAKFDVVFLSGRGPLFLLGGAKGWLFNSSEASLYGGELGFKDVHVLARPTAVPDSWRSEKGPPLDGKVGRAKCEFRRMVEFDVVEAARLIGERGGRQLEASDEPESSDRSAPQLSDLLSASISPGVRDVFDAAERFAQRSGDWAPLTSEYLLDGLLQTGEVDLNTSTSNNGAVVNFVRLILARQKSPTWMAHRLSGDVGEKGGPNYGRRVAPDVRAIFDLATDLTARTGRPGSRMAARHLVVAVLALASYNDRETDAQRILREAGLPVSELKVAFVTSLIKDGPEEERAGWARVLHPDEQPAAADPARAWLPSFNADLASGDDKLNIATDVAAMASLIVSNTLQPPLSIGLFGNWGSGKSFFMEKLRDKIRDLSRNTDPDDRRVYWSNVVTVEFNAWHYVDANLWASLVAHLFAQLRLWGKPEDGVTEQVLQQKNAALNQLKVATEARESAKKRLDDAERALEKANHNRDEAVSSVRLNNHALSRQLVRDLWAELKGRKDLAGPLETAASTLHESHLVATKSVESVEELHARLKEVGETAGHLRATARTMLHGKGIGVALSWLLGGTAVALLLGIKSEAWNFDFGPTASVVAQAAAIVIGAAQWVTRSARHVSGLIAPLDDVRQKIERAFKSARDERDQLVEKFKKEVEASMVQVTVSTQALAAAEQSVAAAKAAVEDATTARMISRFIEGRAASDDYRKHLGIVSTIREDFDQLSKLITAHNKLLLNPSADAVADEAKNLGINRIVLFVDDLDRCPPARVVEVLQAIHLLLAFPLFVVVVGVDSRWVEHSLAVRHPELLKRASDRDRGSAKKRAEANGSPNEAPATPSDYLEKIFQIPYRVRRMDDSGCRNLIDALVESDRDIQRPAPAPVANVLSPSSPPPTPGPPGLPPRTPAPGVAPSPGLAQQVPPPPPPANHAPPLKSPSAAVIKIPIESLRLTEPEILMMRRLSPLIGRSPRATKRFVNIYRLIKAAVPPAEQQAFVAGGFRAPMMLLATTTRGPEFVRELAAGASRDGGPERIARLQNLWTVQFGESLRNETEETRAEFAEITAVWRQLEADSVRLWQRRIAQFSFEETLPA